MSKEKYNQIIDDAYKNYVKSFFTGTLEENYTSNSENFDDYYMSIMEHQHLLGWPQDGPISKEEFINQCKTDSGFSEKWRLKIGERDLSSRDERVKLYEEKTNVDTSFFPALRETLDFHNIPTKLITLEYNNEKIEIYE